MTHAAEDATTIGKNTMDPNAYHNELARYVEQYVTSSDRISDLSAIPTPEQVEQQFNEYAELLSDWRDRL